MTARSTIALATLCTLTFAACSTKTSPPPPPTVTAGSTSTATGGSRQQEVTIAAIVEKVDTKERLVTLRGPDGNLQTVRLGPEVRNLPQVRRGDEVIVSYYQSVAFEVLKPGEGKLGVAAGEGVARAPVGDKPGALGARVVTVVADIVKLDRKNQQAVLKGPEGNMVTVDVQNPENFDKVKVGDRVEITFTEAIAIDVQAAPKKR